MHNVFTVDRFSGMSFKGIVTSICSEKSIQPGGSGNFTRDSSIFSNTNRKIKDSFSKWEDISPYFGTNDTLVFNFW